MALNGLWQPAQPFDVRDPYRVRREADEAGVLREEADLRVHVHLEGRARGPGGEVEQRYQRRRPRARDLAAGGHGGRDGRQFRPRQQPVEQPLAGGLASGPAPAVRAAGTQLDRPEAPPAQLHRTARLNVTMIDSLARAAS